MEHAAALYFPVDAAYPPEGGIGVEFLSILDNVADLGSAVGGALVNLLRRPRRLIALAVLLTVAAILLALLARLGVKSELKAAPDLMGVVAVGIAVAVTLAGLSQSMLKYLRSDFEPRSIREIIKLDEVSHRLSRIEERAIGLSPETRDNVIAAIVDEASRKIGDDFQSELQKRYAAAAESIARASRVRATADRMLGRLQTEVRALMRRGNLNLVLGTLTTGAAAAILAYVALTAKLGGGDWRGYMPTYLMRLSVVVFIEIFAFFFLRLYRASLADIKYFPERDH
jgi:hypothetical protein